MCCFYEHQPIRVNLESKKILRLKSPIIYLLLTRTVVVILNSKVRNIKPWVGQKKKIVGHTLISNVIPQIF